MDVPDEDALKGDGDEDDNENVEEDGLIVEDGDCLGGSPNLGEPVELTHVGGWSVGEGCERVVDRVGSLESCVVCFSGYHRPRSSRKPRQRRDIRKGNVCFNLLRKTRYSKGWKCLRTEHAMAKMDGGKRRREDGNEAQRAVASRCIQVRNQRRLDDLD